MNPITGPRQGFSVNSAAVRRWASQTILAVVVAVFLQLIATVEVVMFDLLPYVERDRREFEQPDAFVANALGGLLIAPFFETALMGWLIIFLINLQCRRSLILIGSATIWAGLHQLNSNVGWLTFVPFFFFSLMFMVRRQKPHEDAYIVTSMTHFYLNALYVMVPILQRLL